MKLGQYDTFVLDVPHRSVWSVYKYLSKKYRTPLIDSLSKRGIITETLPEN